VPQMYWTSAARVDSTLAGLVTVIARWFCANAQNAAAQVSRIVFVMLRSLAAQIHSPYYACAEAEGAPRGKQAKAPAPRGYR
jgi:hypothetical protein